MSIFECMTYAVISAVIGLVSGFGVSAISSLYDTVKKLIS